MIWFCAVAAAEPVSVDGVEGWGDVRWGDAPPESVRAGGNGPGREHYQVLAPGFAGLDVERTTYEYADGRMVAVLQVFRGASTADRLLEIWASHYGPPQHSDGVVDVWRGERVRLTIRRQRTDLTVASMAWVGEPPASR